MILCAQLSDLCARRGKRKKVQLISSLILNVFCLQLSHFQIRDFAKQFTSVGDFISVKYLEPLEDF